MAASLQGADSRMSRATARARELRRQGKHGIKPSHYLPLLGLAQVGESTGALGKIDRRALKRSRRRLAVRSVGDMGMAGHQKQ